MSEDKIVLPTQEIKQFLLDLIASANYPGRMLDFVIEVRNLITNAEIIKAEKIL